MTKINPYKNKKLYLEEAVDNKLLKDVKKIGFNILEII